MPEAWTHAALSDVETNPEKPGRRWELSPVLGVDAFNFNVAVLEPGDRLSQSHFHYHENQHELFFVTSGRCRVETLDERLDLSADEAIRFSKGEDGTHVIHNPFDEPCRLVAIGWPQDGRRPVHTVKTVEELLKERDD